MLCLQHGILEGRKIFRADLLTLRQPVPPGFAGCAAGGAGRPFDIDVKLHIMVSAVEPADIDCFRQLEGMRTTRETVRELIALGLRVAPASIQIRPRSGLPSAWTTDGDYVAIVSCVEPFCAAVAWMLNSVRTAPFRFWMETLQSTPIRA